MGNLQATSDSQPQPFFQAPLTIDGTQALPNALPGTPSSYLDSVNALTTSPGVTSPAGVAPLPGGANGWQNFAFGNRITHLTVKSDLGTGTPLPILTMSRTIPVQTPQTSATGFRRLPGPFSILIDLPVSAQPRDLIAVALLDPAANSAFAQGTAKLLVGPFRSQISIPEPLPISGSTSSSNATSAPAPDGRRSRVGFAPAAVFAPRHGSTADSSR